MLHIICVYTLHISGTTFMQSFWLIELGLGYKFMLHGDCLFKVLRYLYNLPIKYEHTYFCLGYSFHIGSQMIWLRPGQPHIALDVTNKPQRVWQNW